MKKLLFHCENYQSTALNGAILLLRLSFGLTMAFAHGLGKIPPSSQLIDGVTGMGFPMPIAFAWAAALSEFLGGLFIALGLATRLSALSLSITMSVAAFIVHASDPFRVKEMALAYLVVAIFVFIAGPGKYSIDGMINRG